MSAQAALKLKATSLGKAPLKPSKIHTMKSAYPVNHVKVDEKFSINKDKSTGSKNECQNLRKFSAVSEDISAMVENKCCLCGTSVSLKEKNLVIKDNDDVCCIKCIEEEMAVKCSKCKQVS